MTIRERALGAFYGLAVGDALGMPTQGLSRETVVELFGRLEGFEPGPEANEISRGLPAGRVTDDTEQAVIVAEALVEGRGRVDAAVLAERLLAWERDVAARGSLDLLGPSTKRALTELQGGASVEDAGRWGDTNGAAMRVTPVGIATPPQPLHRLVAAAADAGRVTHNTTIAIAGAAAVAAAVSAGVDGSDVDAALDAGERAAEVARTHGHYVAGADVARRIGWAVALVRGRDPDDALDDVTELVGTSLATQESVPAAFAIAALSPDDPWRAGLLAAGLGGDSDTIAAMAVAIVGACCGLGAVPADAAHVVRTTNHLELEPLVDELLALRVAATGAAS
jgi:ADP-ribosylglycohydrolase